MIARQAAARAGGVRVCERGAGRSPRSCQVDTQSSHMNVLKDYFFDIAGFITLGSGACIRGRLAEARSLCLRGLVRTGFRHCVAHELTLVRALPVLVPLPRGVVHGYDLRVKLVHARLGHQLHRRLQLAHGCCLHSSQLHGPLLTLPLGARGAGRP